MRSELIRLQTGNRAQVRDITDECSQFLADVPSTQDGLLHVFVPHATAGVAILETGAGSDLDLLTAIDQLLPRDNRWQHQHGSAGHGRDHVLPGFIAPFTIVPVIAAQLQLGTWQSICLVDTNIDNAERQVRLSFVPA